METRPESKETFSEAPPLPSPAKYISFTSHTEQEKRKINFQKAPEIIFQDKLIKIATQHNNADFKKIAGKLTALFTDLKIFGEERSLQPQKTSLEKEDVSFSYQQQNANEPLLFLKEIRSIFQDIKDNTQLVTLLTNELKQIEVDDHIHEDAPIQNINQLDHIQNNLISYLIRNYTFNDFFSCGDDTNTDISILLKNIEKAIPRALAPNRWPPITDESSTERHERIINAVFNTILKTSDFQILARIFNKNFYIGARFSLFPCFSSSSSTLSSSSSYKRSCWNIETTKLANYIYNSIDILYPKINKPYRQSITFTTTMSTENYINSLIENLESGIVEAKTLLNSITTDNEARIHRASHKNTNAETNVRHQEEEISIRNIETLNNIILFLDNTIAVLTENEKTTSTEISTQSENSKGLRDSVHVTVDTIRIIKQLLEETYQTKCYTYRTMLTTTSRAIRKCGTATTIRYLCENAEKSTTAKKWQHCLRAIEDLATEKTYSGGSPAIEICHIILNSQQEKIIPIPEVVKNAIQNIEKIPSLNEETSHGVQSSTQYNIINAAAYLNKILDDSNNLKNRDDAAYWQVKLLQEILLQWIKYEKKEYKESLSNEPQESKPELSLKLIEFKEKGSKPAKFKVPTDIKNAFKIISRTYKQPQIIKQYPNTTLWCDCLNNLKQYLEKHSHLIYMMSQITYSDPQYKANKNWNYSVFLPLFEYLFPALFIRSPNPSLSTSSSNEDLTSSEGFSHTVETIETEERYITLTPRQQRRQQDPVPTPPAPANITHTIDFFLNKIKTVTPNEAKAEYLKTLYSLNQLHNTNITNIEKENINKAIVTILEKEIQRREKLYYGIFSPIAGYSSTSTRQLLNEIKKIREQQTNDPNCSVSWSDFLHTGVRNLVVPKLLYSKNRHERRLCKFLYALTHDRPVTQPTQIQRIKTAINKGHLITNNDAKQLSHYLLLNNSADTIEENAKNAEKHARLLVKAIQNKLLDILNIINDVKNPHIYLGLLYHKLKNEIHNIFKIMEKAAITARKAEQNKQEPPPWLWRDCLDDLQRVAQPIAQRRAANKSTARLNQQVVDISDFINDVTFGLYIHDNLQLNIQNTPEHVASLQPTVN
jgi:hypothetical protein